MNFGECNSGHNTVFPLSVLSHIVQVPQHIGFNSPVNSSMSQHPAKLSLSIAGCGGAHL
jgi:hypothetical protein